MIINISYLSPHHLNTTKMPCPWSRRACAAAATELPAPTASKDVEDWKMVRRRNIRQMRKQTKTIMLLMALMEALRVGPLQMVYAGTDNFPPKSADDYGVSTASAPQHHKC